jgi:ATP-binding cassette subfamily B protein
VPLESVSRESIGQLVGYVGQNPFVFSGTIAQNIAYGLEWATREQVEQAARRACLHDEILEMPGEYDAIVSERGQNLSGGQRQRLALARALVRTPRLLVLDDATSSVDPRVEARILRGLREAQTGGDGSTVVMIAYRRATIALADEVVYMERGRVVDRGTHAELLAASVGYRTLVTAYERAEAERAEAGRAGAGRAGAGRAGRATAEVLDLGPGGLGSGPLDAGEEAMAQ